MEPVIRAATAREGTPYLDLTPAFQARSDATSRLYLLKREPTGELTGDGHLSREGNAVVGELLAEWLERMGLVGN
jgi:lysophospholipase L1-like esterase